jgi:DNA-binding response OmpR family regulator
VTAILVADDDPDIASLVAAKLRRAGYEVHVCDDGEAALIAAEHLRPDLVLLDWTMPKLTGLEVCIELRRRDHFAALSIVLLTARSSEEDVQQGLAAGANDYIVKPFSPRHLLARVATALGHHPPPPD